MEATAQFIAALAALLWPFIVVGAVFLFRKNIAALLRRADEIHLGGLRLVIRPTRGGTLVSSTGEGEALSAVEAEDALPADYLFLEHIAFVREGKQAESRRGPKDDAVYFDIRIVLDTFYDGALEQVRCVEYLLHHAYNEPVRVRCNRRDHFMLKELAYGEFVLLAKAHFFKRKEPMVLQRYITLYEGMKEKEWKDWLAKKDPAGAKKAREKRSGGS